MKRGVGGEKRRRKKSRKEGEGRKTGRKREGKISKGGKTRQGEKPAGRREKEAWQEKAGEGREAQPSPPQAPAVPGGAGGGAGPPRPGRRPVSVERSRCCRLPPSLLPSFSALLLLLSLPGCAQAGGRERRVPLAAEVPGGRGCRWGWGGMENAGLGVVVPLLGCLLSAVSVARGRGFPLLLSSGS